MKHFTSEDIENNTQFEMGNIFCICIIIAFNIVFVNALGFAKLRRLKRGAVPTIYEENLGDSQRAERAQHRENKRIVSKLLEQSETAVATAGNHLHLYKVLHYTEAKFL